MPIDENQHYYLAAKLNEILFISHSYTIADCIITFEVDTYTEPFMNEITKRNTEVLLEIGYNTNGVQQVLLRDYALAQPRVYIEGLDPHKVDFGDYFTKEETIALLSGKVNTDALSGYYTKGETDDLMNDKADADSLSAFYTKGESDALLDEKADTEDLSAYFTKDEIIDQLSPKDFLIQSSDLIADMLTVSGGCRYKFTQPKNKIIITEAKVNVDEAEIYAKFDIDYTISRVTSALTIGGYSIGYDEDDGTFKYVNLQEWTLTQTDPTAEGTDRVFQTTFTAPDPGYTSTEAWSAWYDTESASWVMRCFFDPVENQWVIINSYTYNDTTTSGYFAKGNPNRKALEVVEWEITSDYSSFLPLGNYNQEGLDYNGDGAPAIRNSFVEQNGVATIFEPEIKIPNGFTFIGEPEIEVGKTYAISLYNKLVAISEVGDDAIEIDPFEIEVKDAELFGKASSVNDYHVTMPNGDKVAYWTENTIIPNDNMYTLSGLTQGNVWLKIENKDMSPTSVVYGLSSNEVLSGDVHFLAKNTKFRSGAITGAAGSKCKDAYITLENCLTSGVFFCSLGEAENLFVHIKGGSYCDRLNSASDFDITQRGSGLGNTKVTINDIYFTCDGGEFYQNLIIGPNVKTKATQVDLCYEVHDITAVLNDGLVSGHADQSIFCGFVSGQKNKDTASFNDIKVIINGGDWLSNSTENGVGIFAGPVSNNGRVIINNITIEQNGGDVSTLFAGGYPENDGKVDVMGDVHVTINGGTVFNVLGISTHSGSIIGKTGYSHYHGNIYVHINGGDIKNLVHPGHRHGETRYNLTPDQEKLDGDAFVIVSGNTDYRCMFQGNYLYEETTSTPQYNLIFTNYTGTLLEPIHDPYSIVGFAHIGINENSAVKIIGQVANNTSTWDIDISKRSVVNADVPTLSGFSPERNKPHNQRSQPII